MAPNFTAPSEEARRSRIGSEDDRPLAEEAYGVGMDAAEVDGDGDGDGGGSWCKTEETLTCKTMEKRKKVKAMAKEPFAFLCFFFFSYFILFLICVQSYDSNTIIIKSNEGNS